MSITFKCAVCLCKPCRKHCIEKDFNCGGFKLNDYILLIYNYGYMILVYFQCELLLVTIDMFVYSHDCQDRMYV